MADQVEVAVLDEFSAHGENNVQSTHNDRLRNRWFQWPLLGESWRACVAKETLVAKVNGGVVGRVGVNTVYYPFARLMGLEVLPAFRGRGIGGQLDRDRRVAFGRPPRTLTYCDICEGCCLAVPGSFVRPSRRDLNPPCSHAVFRA